MSSFLITCTELDYEVWICSRRPKTEKPFVTDFTTTGKIWFPIGIASENLVDVHITINKKLWWAFLWGFIGPTQSNKARSDGTPTAGMGYIEWDRIVWFGLLDFSYKWHYTTVSLYFVLLTRLVTLIRNVVEKNVASSDVHTPSVQLLPQAKDQTEGGMEGGKQKKRITTLLRSEILS